MPGVMTTKAFCSTISVVAAFGGAALLWWVWGHAGARLMRWKLIADAYPAGNEPITKWFRFRTLFLPYWHRHPWRITFGTGPTGLRIAFSYPWAGHRPIFLPWSEIEADVVRSFRTCVRLKVERLPGLYLYIYAGLARKLFAAAPLSFTRPAGLAPPAEP